MNIRLNLFVLIIMMTLSLTMCQCSLNQQELYQGKPLIKVDIAWRANVYQYASYAYLIDGNTAYIPEGDGVAAINLDNGSIIWKTNGVFVSKSNVEKIGNYLYIFERYDSIEGNTNARIAKISSDGKSIEMLNVGPEQSWSTRMYYLSSYGKKLYWGSLGTINGTKLISLDTETLEKVEIFSTSNQIMGKILISNNIAYVGHIQQAGISDRKIHGTITALNLSNNTAIWEKTPTYANYLGAFPFVIKDDRLYVFDSRVTACFNNNTGEEIFNNTNTEGGYFGGGIFNGDYAYFTSPLYNGKRVYCINRNNGAIVWSDSGEQLGTTPHINNGVLYVAEQTHLRLYNATNGQVIGVTTSIKGQTFQLSPTERYKDLMLICNDEEMIAVRMNYKL